MIRVRMLANWCDSRHLCDVFAPMTTDGAGTWEFRDLDGAPQQLRMTWDDDDPDIWVVINRPPAGFDERLLDPARTVVFHMEPEMWTVAMRSQWGTWAVPSPLSFLQVRDHRRYRNSNDWWVGRSYAELTTEPSPTKDRVLSACVSEKYFDPGHVKRIDFLRFLDGTDLDLDIYGNEANGFAHGRGRTPLHDKSSSLLPYRYAFNAENHSTPNYYTEKLVDCLLSETLCFYWGCPNLDSFFDPRAYVRLELDDFDADLARIRRAIENDEWSERLPFIRAEKARVLDEYQFFPTLARVIDPVRRRRRWSVGPTDAALVDDWIGERRSCTFVEISDRGGDVSVSETLDVERRLDWSGLCLEADHARGQAARAVRDCTVVLDDGHQLVGEMLEHNGLAPHSIEWLNLAVESPSALLRSADGGEPRLDMARVRANLISVPRASTDERGRTAELLAPRGYELAESGDAFVRRSRDEIFGFYHLCTINTWRDVLGEQLAVWHSSGLLDATSCVFVTVVGPEATEGRRLLADALGERLVVVSCTEDASSFERPILEHARWFCATEGSLARAIWYMHSKGVSPQHCANPGVGDWRRFLQYHVVDRWTECAATVRDHDVCGVNWHTEPRPHFSGNFWWAAPQYVANLPAEVGASHFDQEAWIGTDQPRVRSFAESAVDHYVERYPARRYRSDAIERPTICLNMIVKDEAHVVGEVLADSAPHIDTWVIVDTGSTDGTPGLIRSFFSERGIPGELHQRPWRDFATNRTEALELCAGAADYAWVIDADDRVVGDLDLTDLEADSYSLRYGDDFTYWRPQLFRLGLPWSFKGTVHEYAVCAGGCREARLDGSYHLESRRLGARNLVGGKYERDAELLRAAVAADPDDARSVFYLAQTARDQGDLETALEWYERRADMGGWDEEVFLARLERARILERLGEAWPRVLDAYLDAWQARPTRAEPLHEIARRYRERGSYDLGYVFAARAAEIDIPPDALFVATDVYRWRALDELAICAYYTGRHQESFDLSTRLLRTPGIADDDRERILANRDFAVRELVPAVPDHPEAIIERLVARVESGAPYDVTLTITTCRRRELFEATIDSFLAACIDLDRIGRFVCIDDGSSAADRERMQSRYPFFEFVLKERAEAGHARSMEILRGMVETPYWLHLEDDWQFFVPDRYVGTAQAILDHDPRIGQVLFNRNYGETLACRELVGGVVTEMASGERYRLHQYLDPGTDEGARFFASLAPGRRTNVWWPHFSLRPSMLRTASLADLGPFEADGHFELDFARRYTDAGLVSAFFDEITCLHIGRRTFERGPDAPENAYNLNAMPQFVAAADRSDESAVRVLSLDRRPDRWRAFVDAMTGAVGSAFAQQCMRRPGVDGATLILTPELRRIFRGNDFGSRRGFIGCALGHLAIWREVAASGRTTLVFEDDARVGPGFASALTDVRDRLARDHADFDIALLGYHLFSEPTEVSDAREPADGDGPVRVEPLDPLDYVGGLYGYVISPRGARRLLARAEREGVRHGIDRFVHLGMPEVDVLCCVPPIVASPIALPGSGVDSDIQHDLEPLR